MSKFSYFTKLSGTSFRQDEIKKLTQKSKLRLVPRPDNEFDQFAVEVQALLKDGWTQIGWIPKGKNVDIAMLLGEGGKVDISLSSVTGGTDDHPTMGVNVAVEYAVDDSVDMSKTKPEKVIYGDDDLIYFDEAEHNAYDRKGKLLLSGSRFEEKYQPDVDFKYPAKAIAKKTGMIYADVMNMWDVKKDIAASYGTLIHKALEEAHNYRELVWKMDENLEEKKRFTRLFPNDIANVVKEYFLFRKEITPDFLKHKIETEVRIKYQMLTGIVDNLEWTDDGFYIYDYKITENIKTIKYLGIGATFSAKKYTLQQNFYRHILENVTGKKCLGMALLVWDGEKWNKEVIERLDIEELL